MGKNKLAKFADMERLPNVFQYTYATLQEEGGFPFKGKWHSDIFRNDHPIVLELGCGRGEYTVGLGRNFAKKNFIGIDIKGNRMWTGAMMADKEGLSNVRFLRTHIELLDHFFAPSEVSEIWLTFPDPQMKKVRLRLTSTRFLKLYQSIVNPQGCLHLKSDSNFLYQYTKAVAEYNQLKVLKESSNIYQSDSQGGDELPAFLTTIKTYYEQQWLGRGITIKYLCIALDERITQCAEPDVEIEPDEYRSYGRNRRSQLNLPTPQLI